MGKTIAIFILSLIVSGCTKSNNNCPSKPQQSINAQFLDWTKLYPNDGTITYIRFKSNKGQEESLRIGKDMMATSYYLEDNCENTSNQGEAREYYLSSTIYNRHFGIAIGQITAVQTDLNISSYLYRYYDADYTEIRFSDASFNIIHENCDTCVNILNNVIINNKAYTQVIRMYCPIGANETDSVGVKEMLVAKGYGLIQYTCTDSSTWNIEY